MEVTDEQLADVFKGALTCYLGILSRASTIRDTNLPKHGKSPQTNSDISVDQEFRTRVAATEICLQYTQNLAASVCHWASEPLDDDQRLDNEVDSTLKLESLIPDLDEDLLLDIFSGKWVEPETPFSAGPSGSGNSLIDRKNKNLSDIYVCFPPPSIETRSLISKSSTSKERQRLKIKSRDSFPTNSSLFWMARIQASCRVLRVHALGDTIKHSSPIYH